MIANCTVSMNKNAIFNVIEELNAELNVFLEEYELTASFSKDFAYDSAENVIYYSLIAPAQDSTDFETFVKSIDPNVSFNVFLMSFLHEVGHHETMHIISDEEITYYMNNRDDMDSFEYFNTAVEKEATLWAIDYSYDEGHRVKQLWDNIQPLIERFYNELDSITIENIVF